MVIDIDGTPQADRWRGEGVVAIGTIVNQMVDPCSRPSLLRWFAGVAATRWAL